MSLRDRLFELTTPEEVDAFLKNHLDCAIFKAGGCHKTMQGFGYVEQVMDARSSLPVGFIKVIENRPASNRVEESTGIIHESPQFILFKEGKAVYDVDNWNIVPEVLEASLLKHFGPVALADSPKKNTQGNVERYVQLLKKYVENQMDEKSFAQEWLETFRLDSALRSSEEFSLLNSLFGDVDLAYSSMATGGEALLSNSLKTRAESLLEQISSR